MGNNMKRIIALLSILSTNTFAADAPATGKVLASENGRYVFGQISEYRRDQYMLDTKTGRLWRVVNVPLKNEDGTVAPGEGIPALEVIRYRNPSDVGFTVEPK